MKDAFRVYVYTRHGFGIPAPDIQSELTAIHGDASPSLRTIFRWIAEIKSGTFEYQKKGGPGRPVSSTTPEKIREIKSEIEQNCRLSCRELSTIVNLDKSAVYNVLTQHLDLRNVFSVWVPHTLSISNKQQRVDCANRILKMFATHPLEYIQARYCVQDESWVLWDAEPTRRVWIGKKQVKPTTAKQKLTNRKNMIMVAFTCKPKRFSVTVIAKGSTVNSDVVVDYIKATGHRFLNLKNNKIHLRDLLWQMDNARPHTSRITQDYVTKIGLSLVKQSPYSPDMNLCDRYLFRVLKHDLKQEALGSVSEVQKAVQRCFRRLSENTLADQLLKLRDHCGHVVSSGGDYISSQ